MTPDLRAAEIKTNSADKIRKPEDRIRIYRISPFETRVKTNNASSAKSVGETYCFGANKE
jgi:hypothetical protein